MVLRVSGISQKQVYQKLHDVHCKGFNFLKIYIGVGQTITQIMNLVTEVWFQFMKLKSFF